MIQFTHFQLKSGEMILLLVMGLQKVSKLTLPPSAYAIHLTSSRRVDIFSSNIITRGKVNTVQ